MRRRIRRGLLFLIVVFGASFLAWRLVLREPLLLKRARRVADITQWGLGGRRFNESIRNHWISDHEVLFDRFEGAQHDQRMIYKREIETGQETKLPGLTASRRTLGEEVIDSECVSPDGKWYTGSARWNECLLAEVNGTRHYLYPYAAASEHNRSILWLPNNHHWIERYGHDDSLCLVMHDTQNPATSTKLSIKTNSTLADMDMAVAPDKAVAIEWPDEVMNDFGEPIVKADSPSTQQVSIHFTSLQKSDKPIAHYSLTVPFGLKHHEFSLSPNADHVAWLVHTHTEAPLQAWLHRYFPSVKPIQYQKTAIWVSNIEGNHRYEIGRITEMLNTTDALASNEPKIKELKWLPGGKYLSFEYKNALYVVPIQETQR